MVFELGAKFLVRGESIKGSVKSAFMVFEPPVEEDIESSLLYLPFGKLLVAFNCNCGLCGFAVNEKVRFATQLVRSVSVLKLPFGAGRHGAVRTPVIGRQPHSN